MISFLNEIKFRNSPGCAQRFHRLRLGPAHGALSVGPEIVVPGEVKPAVGEVKGQFLGEIPAMGRRESGGGFRGNANLAGRPKCGLAREGDDIGDRRVPEEPPVKIGERRVGEKSD